MTNSPDYASVHYPVTLALTCLVEASARSQALCRELFLPHSPLAYIKEFCLTRCCTSRRSGHTSAVASVIWERFDRTILLGPNARIRQHALDTGTSLYGPKFKDKIVLSAGFRTQDTINLKGYEPDAVVVECASMISSSAFDRLCEVMVPIVQEKKRFFLLMIQ